MNHSKHSTKSHCISSFNLLSNPLHSEILTRNLLRRFFLAMTCCWTVKYKNEWNAREERKKNCESCSVEIYSNDLTHFWLCSTISRLLTLSFCSSWKRAVSFRFFFALQIVFDNIALLVASPSLDEDFSNESSCRHQEIQGFNNWLNLRLP